MYAPYFPKRNNILTRAKTFPSRAPSTVAPVRALPSERGVNPEEPRDEGSAFLFPFCACPILLALKVALLRTCLTFFASPADPLLSSPRIFQTRAVVESQRRIPDRVLIMMVEQIFHVPHHHHAMSHSELRSQVQAKMARITRQS